MKMKLSREQKVAHRFLSSFDMVDDRLESALSSLERAESARSSITSSIEGLGLSPSQNDRMLDALARMDSSIDDIRALADKFREQFRDIEEIVTEVQRIDALAGRAIRLVYVNGLSVKEAASAEMHCSKKTTYEHVKRGLEITYDILGRERP